MKAVLCHEFGSVDNLTVGDAPSPTPGHGEVTIEVHACGIQFVDNRIIEGNSLLNTAKLNDHFGKDMRVSFPLVPGSEAAGIVKEVGDGVNSVKPGDRVLGTCIIGAYAEVACFQEDEIYPIPDEMDFETAAGFYVAYFTAYYSLLTRGYLKENETLALSLLSLVFGRVAARLMNSPYRLKTKVIG